MGKGRNTDLMMLRDDALCRRYYELTEKQRLRFDDALKILSQHEFFISEQRIMAIIRKRLGEIEGIALKPVPRVRMPRITARQLDFLQKLEEGDERRADATPHREGDGGQEEMRKM